MHDNHLSYPFLKWAGGKTQILSELENLVPSEFTRYFEPFLGGGALFFHLTTKRNIRPRAYLSDINEELITTYKVVKDDVEKLIALLVRHQTDYTKNPTEFYSELRSIVPATDIEIAARMITLNKTCHNGLYRDRLSILLVLLQASLLTQLAGLLKQIKKNLAMSLES